MKQNRLNSPHFIIFTINFAIIALLLSIVPLPTWLTFFRPEWLIILVIYYCIAFPRFSVLSFAWCLGLLLDVLYGSLLGMHALGLTMVAYFSHLFYKQMRVQSLWQQAIWVFFLVLLNQMLCLLIKMMIGEPYNYSYLFPAASSMVVWPLCATILLRLEQRTSFMV